MISYKSNTGRMCLRYQLRAIMQFLAMPSIQRAFFTALPSAMLAGAIKWADNKGMYSEYFTLEEWIPEDTAYSSYTFLLGFFIIFHTNHAYERFNFSTRMLYTIMGNFVDMASLTLSFTKASKADAVTIREFKQNFIRLASLLFAVSVGDLEGKDDANENRYNLVDPKGIDPDVLHRVSNATHKPEVVCQILQCHIVEGMGNGVMCIPPPILTRAFQELSNAMIQFSEIRCVKEIPFPFPFVAIADLLLACHLAFTPFFMAFWCRGVAGAAGWTWMVVFTMWLLHNMALELDNPFGGSINDLDMFQAQEQLNGHLLALLSQSSADELNAENTNAADLLTRFRSSRHSVVSMSMADVQAELPIRASESRASKLTGESSLSQTSKTSAFASFDGGGGNCRGGPSANDLLEDGGHTPGTPRSNNSPGEGEGGGGAPASRASIQLPNEQRGGSSGSGRPRQPEAPDRSDDQARALGKAARRGGGDSPQRRARGDSPAVSPTRSKDMAVGVDDPKRLVKM